ncbi:MAG: hypothetical protein ABJN40_07655 [Sneathiella sp.]
MGLMFKDLGNTLSIKSRYSRLLSSSSLVLLVAILSAVFLIEMGENSTLYEKTASYMQAEK